MLSDFIFAMVVQLPVELKQLPQYEQQLHFADVGCQFLNLVMSNFEMLGQN